MMVALPFLMHQTNLPRKATGKALEEIQQSDSRHKDHRLPAEKDHRYCDEDVNDIVDTIKDREEKISKRACDA